MSQLSDKEAFDREYAEEVEKTKKTIKALASLLSHAGHIKTRLELMRLLNSEVAKINMHIGDDIRDKDAARGRAWI